MSWQNILYTRDTRHKNFVFAICLLYFVLVIVKRTRTKTMMNLGQFLYKYGPAAVQKLTYGLQISNIH